MKSKLFLSIFYIVSNDCYSQEQAEALTNKIVKMLRNRYIKKEYE